MNISDNQIQREQGVLLEAATVECGKRVGLKHETTARLLRTDGSAEKSEPVFVLRKPVQ